MDYYAIGQRIRARRKVLGLSQEQLAELVDISVTHMSHIETGNTKLSLPVLVALSQALHCTTDALLFDADRLQHKDVLAEITALLQSCTAQEAYLLQAVVEGVKAALDRSK